MIRTVATVALLTALSSSAAHANWFTAIFDSEERARINAEHKAHQIEYYENRAESTGKKVFTDTQNIYVVLDNTTTVVSKTELRGKQQHQIKQLIIDKVGEDILEAHLDEAFEHQEVTQEVINQIKDDIANGADVKEAIKASGAVIHTVDNALTGELEFYDSVEEATAAAEAASDELNAITAATDSALANELSSAGVEFDEIKDGVAYNNGEAVSQ